MDPGLRSPLVDFFRRGEVASDVRLLAARGAFAPRAHEQLALLLILADDPDLVIAETARRTLDSLPADSLGRFLARRDVPQQMIDFFSARGVHPHQGMVDEDAPLVEAGGDPISEETSGESDPKLLSALPVIDRMKLAMRGTREQRAQLIRDPNRMVSAAVLSSPKLTDAEVESFTKMGNVSEDVLRVIAMNRQWLKNYGVLLGLTKNPKTPPALSMQFIHRLNERDVKSLAVDRNVPEGLRLAAKKIIVKSLK
jgi:hypothetical protein